MATLQIKANFPTPTLGVLLIAKKLKITTEDVVKFFFGIIRQYATLHDLNMAVNP